MIKSILNTILYCIASSLLLYLSWPPVDFGYLLLFAFIPVFHVVYNQKNILQAGIWFYSTMFIFLLVGHIPVLSDNIDILYFFIGLILVSFLWTVPLIISIVIKQKFGLRPALLLFPLLYLCLELLQYNWEFSVVWFHLGLGISTTPFLLNIVQFVGQEGATLLLLYSNVFIYFLIVRYREKQLNKIHFFPIASIFIFILLSNLTFLIPEKTKHTANIAVFQPNKAETEGTKNNLEGQIRLLEDALTEYSFKGTDVLICPESYFSDMEHRPLNVNNIYSHPAIVALGELSSTYNTPILAGATLVKLYKSDTPPNLSAKLRSPGIYYDIINGSIFITPNKEIEWRSKQKLIPFIETFPLYKIKNWLFQKRIVSEPYTKSYAIIPYSKPYSYGKLVIAPSICYEGLFPNIMSAYLKGKSNLQVVLSTSWTQSEILQNIHHNYNIVNVQSFKTPLLYASLDKQSVLYTKHHQEKLTKLLDIKTVYLQRANKITTTIANNYWLFYSITIVSILFLFIKKFTAK